MVKKFKRQALRISINQLIKLINNLIEEEDELKKSLGINIEDYDKEWLIPIINKTPRCCDTWEIEDEKKEN